MNHYYIANEDMLDFNIALNPEIGLTKKESHAIIKDLDILNAGNVYNDLNPYKNISYFIHRYLKHPYFNYLFWGVFVNDELKLVMVARKIVLENASCYRIMDMLGTLKGVFSIAGEMQRILKENHSEYIDCLNHGIPCEFFEKLGFTKKKSDSLTVIPEYFQPFERQNILLEYAYMSDKPLVIFKGDGDQDRPNVV